jgi:hypothetical protein
VVNERNSTSIEVPIFLIECGLSASLVGFPKTFQMAGQIPL